MPVTAEFDRSPIHGAPPVAELLARPPASPVRHSNRGAAIQASSPVHDPDMLAIAGHSPLCLCHTNRAASRTGTPKSTTGGQLDNLSLRSRTRDAASASSSA